MKKLAGLILTLIMSLFIQQNSVLAESLDKTVSQSGVNKSAVSISVKDVSTGKVVYKLNDNQPKNPASTLKVITYSSALDTLGDDYEFKTELYKSTNNDLYLKLGADPFLARRHLKKIFKTAKEKNIFEPKNIYIDDYILDDVTWGEGWQWDDDLNPLMPKFGSYNIDDNMLEVVISPTQKGGPADIRVSEFYPVTFMNLVTTSDTTSIKISRNNNISPDVINVSGTVARKTSRFIPVNNIRRYFVLRCDDAVKANKLGYYGKYTQKKLPNENVYLVDTFAHSIKDTSVPILKQSNNLVAETVFKVAGGKFVNNTGSLANSQKMLENYFDKLGLNAQNIKITDGSGVSKNNLMTTDFMTEFLVKRYDDKDFVESLATSGEGTLSNRMLYFKDNLRAKTGTLSDVSAIAGYITTRRGNTYAFDIMINDAKSKSQEKKSLEEYILRDLYANY